MERQCSRCAGLRLTNKGWVAHRISLLDDVDMKENRRKYTPKNQFPFLYDGEDDANSGPAEEANEYV